MLSRDRVTFFSPMPKKSPTIMATMLPSRKMMRSLMGPISWPSVVLMTEYPIRLAA
jgi:hypothetical protein